MMVFALCGIALGVHAGCIKGNCKIGKGVFEYKDGSMYTGRFENGHPNGLGEMKYPNGDVYNGDFMHGFREGNGAYTYKSGTKYIGSFSKNKFNGQGKATFKNGDVYSGEWRDNLFHGFGKLIKRNGESYTGDFYQGQKHGKGTLTKTNGIKISGIWKQDVFVKKEEVQPKSIMVSNKYKEYRNCNTGACDGIEGQFTYMDGSYYIGPFTAGRPQGNGTCFYANGDVYTGGWMNHGPNGEGVMTYSDGKKYAAIWEKGKPIKQLFQRPEKEKKTTAPFEADGKVDMYALIIGISAYEHLPRLKYTDDDAYQLFAFLKSPEGGALPDRNINVLIDEAATKDNIKASMKNLFSRADRDDVVIVYYSGHGLQGRFLPIDFDGSNNSLGHEEIYDMLRSSYAKNKILIADACYSGSLFQQKGTLGGSLSDFYQKVEASPGGTAVLMSSKAEEVSLEYSGLRQGIFSHFLLKGLHGWADSDNNGLVSISELFKYVSESVRNFTDQQQTPTISGKFDLDMPIAMVRQ